jgi:hypothetical protein
MINDDQLSQLLRNALPAIEAVEEKAGPPRDLWTAVVRRSEARVEMSFSDWSLAAIVVIVLLIFPEWFWFLTYHL